MKKKWSMLILNPTKRLVSEKIRKEIHRRRGDGSSNSLISFDEFKKIKLRYKFLFEENYCQQICIFSSLEADLVTKIFKFNCSFFCFQNYHLQETACCCPVTSDKQMVEKHFLITNRNKSLKRLGNVNISEYASNVQRVSKDSVLGITLKTILSKKKYF